MSDLVSALCAAAAVLLVASSLAKLRAPGTAAAMLVALVGPLRRRPALLRPAALAIGLGEGTVGVLVLVLGGRLPALLLTAAYLVFTVVAVLLVRSPRPVACGCFGRSEAPVTRSHVLLDLVATTVAAAAVAVDAAPWGGLTDDGVAVALAGPVLIGLVAWLAYLSVTALPALAADRRLLEAA